MLTTDQLHHLVGRAIRDASFREDLIDNPHAAQVTLFGSADSSVTSAITALASDQKTALKMSPEYFTAQALLNMAC